jgi:hypothetical protein
MASLFDKLNKEATASGIRKNTKRSLGWFREKVAAISSVNSKSLLNDDNLKQVNTPLVGRMFMYFYDPKTKDTLPHYDKFPLVIMVDKAPGGFYGLNLHYLEPRLRAKFFDLLLEYSNNNKYDKTTRIKMSYDLLKASTKLSAFKPCYKRYLTKHIKSKIAEVPASEWDVAIFLPSEQFKKGSKDSVWKNSKSKI